MLLTYLDVFLLIKRLRDPSTMKRGHLSVVTQDPGTPLSSPVFCLGTVIQEGELALHCTPGVKPVSTFPPFAHQDWSRGEHVT